MDVIREAVREWQQARRDINKLQANGPKDPTPEINVKILSRLANAEYQLVKLEV